MNGHARATVPKQVGLADGHGGVFEGVRERCTSKQQRRHYFTLGRYPQRHAAARAVLCVGFHVSLSQCQQVTPSANLPREGPFSGGSTSQMLIDGTLRGSSGEDWIMFYWCSDNRTRMNTPAGRPACGITADNQQCARQSPGW